MQMSRQTAAPEISECRYEIKLACPQTQDHIALVSAWVRAHRAAFSMAYPPRRVNNIYFDTHTLANLEDNLAGISERSKLRLRWYGEDLTVTCGQLELKQKRAALGSKIVYPLECVLDLAKTTWRDVMRLLRAEDVGELRPYLAGVIPTLINTYKREYYLSADGLVRVTLDTDMMGYSQSLSGRPNLSIAVLRTPAIVVELKGAAKAEQAIKRAVAEFPLSPAAFSKYVNGILNRDFLL
jgi:hypothetical protein